MAKRKRSRSRSRSRRKSGRNRNDQVLVEMPRPGSEGAMHDHCSCPICAATASSGQPMLIVDENGDLVEVRSTPKPMMQVRVRGTTATWPHLSTEFETVDVPEGCVVQDLLGYLTFSNRKFQIAFPHGTLRATIRGEQCQPMRVLMPNDEVVVSGHPDPQLSRLMAKLLTPLP